MEKRIHDLEQKLKLIEETGKHAPDRQNFLLKKLYNKIIYTRVMPREILKLSTRSDERKNFPFEIDADYL